MNKFLNSASERFDKLKGRDFLINPISKADCEIVIELGQILKKVGLTEILQILDSYKELKDEEIRDRLLQWNIDNPTWGIKKLANKLANQIVGDEEDEETKLFSPVYFKIKEFMFHQYDFRGLKTFEKFDEAKADYVYGIILNPVPDSMPLKSVPPYANERVEFNTEEDRNVVLKGLSDFLKGRGFDTINLEENE